MCAIRLPRGGSIGRTTNVSPLCEAYIYRYMNVARQGLPAHRRCVCAATVVPRGVEVAAASLQKAEQFIDILLEVNKVMNLTGIRDKTEAMERHVHDCLALLPTIEAQLGPGAANREIRHVAGRALPLSLRMEPESTTAVELQGHRRRLGRGPPWCHPRRRPADMARNLSGRPAQALRLCGPGRI